MGDVSFPPSIPTVRYVNNGEAQAFSDLLVNYPPSSAFNGMYARISDLFGSVDDILRCRYDGANYRWVPQREAFTGTTAVSSGTVSLIPLVTPPTLRLTTSSLTGNMTINASVVNAYSGQRFRVIVNPLLPISAFTMQITGLIGSNLTLLAGNTRDIEFGSNGWFQST